VKKDILTLLDLTRDDFGRLFQRAREFKEQQRQGGGTRPLTGKTLGLLFDKASTRTRLSFEVAMAQLGGTPIFISARDTQIARDEPVRDTARVLARYLDALAIRTFSQSLLEEFAAFADIPVINALTDLYHPCQVLSDLMTVIELKGPCETLRIAWVGDGNNVCHSWINAAAVLGLDLVLACPQGYWPDAAIMERARQAGGAPLTITVDPREAVAGADVIYTDVWASMGQESEARARRSAFERFQVNQALVDLARPQAIVMHCLPAHRGEEISAEVLEGPRSVVWDQAENKLHMTKAILEALLWPAAHSARQYQPRQGAGS
jgi:ornithine carbamoyltransferase